jgi:hypothetical protein
VSGAGPLRRRLAAVGPLLLLTTAAGCTGPVAVVEPSPDAADRGVCAALIPGLPNEVEGQRRREVQPGVLTAAWGDPPITLRCGVPAPPGLTSSSECLEVDEVGWFNEDVPGGVLFTTIGRATFVEVAVPSAYTPPVNPLVDLAAAVTAHDPLEQPCR